MLEDTYRWYFWGEMRFATLQKRNSTINLLTNLITKQGLVPEIWRAIPESHPEWNLGGVMLYIEPTTLDILLRWCFATDSFEAVEAASNDISAHWDVETNSRYGWGAEPIHHYEVAGIVNTPADPKKPKNNK